MTIASTAISGISYLTTGKSSTDHVISAAIEQDCALTRPIVGEEVCKDIDPNSSEARERVVVAYHPGDRDDGGFRSMHDPALSEGAMQLDSLPQGPAQIAIALPFAGGQPPQPEIPGLAATEAVVIPQPEARPVMASAPATDWTVPEPVARIELTALPAPATERAMAPRVDGTHYVVLGSVRDRARAETLAARFADRGAEIRDVTIDGAAWSRVVVGPFPLAQARSVKAEIGTVHGKTPWIVRTPPVVEQLASR